MLFRSSSQRGRHKHRGCQSVPSTCERRRQRIVPSLRGLRAFHLPPFLRAKFSFTIFLLAGLISTGTPKTGFHCHRDREGPADRCRRNRPDGGSHSLPRIQRNSCTPPVDGRTCRKVPPRGSHHPCSMMVAVPSRDRPNSRSADLSA